MEENCLVKQTKRFAGIWNAFYLNIYQHSISHVFFDQGPVNDFDTLPTQGKGPWYWSPSSKNLPQANTYGICYLFVAIDWYFELAFNTNHPTGVYVRSSINNGGTQWEPWVKIAENSISQKLDSSALLGKTYPVGSIYMSVSATSPASLFGGTWQALEGRFLLGKSNSYSAGATGGEATHTLTAAEMPEHWHNIDNYITDSGAAGNNWALQWGGKSYISGHIPTSNTGSSQAHNNMPPYLVVYMWKRTA